MIIVVDSTPHVHTVSSRQSASGSCLTAIINRLLYSIRLMNEIKLINEN